MTNPRHRFLFLTIGLLLMAGTCRAGDEKTTSQPTQSAAQGSASPVSREAEALRGNPCRFVTTKEVEAIIKARLTVSGAEGTCEYDPIDNSSRGAKYTLDLYKEEVYASLTPGAEAVPGVGEKAAASNLNPGAQLIIKNGNLLVLVTTGGSGFSDFNAARDSAISIAKIILQKL